MPALLLALGTPCTSYRAPHTCRVTSPSSAASPRRGPAPTSRPDHRTPCPEHQTSFLSPFSQRTLETHAQPCSDSNLVSFWERRLCKRDGISSLRTTHFRYTLTHRSMLERTFAFRRHSIGCSIYVADAGNRQSTLLVP